MQMRIALRSGADGVSCLEVLLGALVTGDVRHHQVSIQESLSALLRCNEVLIMDGPLIMNCALAVIDGAFAPLTSGVRDTWRTLKRTNDPPKGNKLHQLHRHGRLRTTKCG